MRFALAAAVLLLPPSIVALEISSQPAVRPLPRLHSLRGGASGRAPLPRKAAGEPSLSPTFVAYCLAWAVVPTALRVAFAVAVLEPLGKGIREVAHASDPITILLRTLGWAAEAAAPELPPLSSRLPLPSAWQVALAGCWVANNVAVMVPGRYDGQRAMAAERPTAETANLFTPAGWAFAIWGPIFAGEWLMMLYLTNLGGGSELGAAMAPGWCAGIAAQVAWCIAFRPSVCGPAMLWVPAALLGATALGLGVSHRAIRSVGHEGWANVLVRWPVTLHFGWITAAALVNLNNWLSRAAASLRVRELSAHASVAAGVAAAAFVTRRTGDGVFALVVAWALGAVVADGARSARGLVSEAVLRRVQRSARIGCGLSALMVCAQL
jgi:hypothetical protein